MLPIAVRPSLSFTELRELQLINEMSPSPFTVLGSSILVRLEQSANALRPIVSSPSESLTVLRFGHTANAF